MPTTRYFEEQVLPRRPYLTMELIRTVLAWPIARVVQADGRIRIWGRVVLPDETEARMLRVVLLEDGQTIHNAFVDRSFREDAR